MRNSWTFAATQTAGKFVYKAPGKPRTFPVLSTYHFFIWAILLRWSLAANGKPLRLNVRCCSRRSIATVHAPQFVYSGFDEVYPLWALATVAKGGLDWSTVQIGKVGVWWVLGRARIKIRYCMVPYKAPYDPG